MILENLIDILKTSLKARLFIRDVIEENYPGFFKGGGTSIHYYFKSPVDIEEIDVYIDVIKILKIVLDDRIKEKSYTDYYKSKYLIIHSGRLFKYIDGDDIYINSPTSNEILYKDFLILIDEMMEVNLSRFEN